MKNARIYRIILLILFIICAFIGTRDLLRAQLFSGGVRIVAGLFCLFGLWWMHRDKT